MVSDSEQMAFYTILVFSSPLFPVKEREFSFFEPAPADIPESLFTEILGDDSELKLQARYRYEPLAVAAPPAYPDDFIRGPGDDTLKSGREARFEPSGFGSPPKRLPGAIKHQTHRIVRRRYT